MEVQIEQSWKNVLQAEFTKPHFHALVHFLKEEKAKGKIIYPPGRQLFSAFEATPFHLLKVLVLGQDPYHGPGQANGLCFSVNDGIAHPPSLQNIFKELQQDLNIPYPSSGNLLPWAKQGVLLLNASLTVEAHKPLSHEHIGWHHFTDEIIRLVSTQKKHVVFILWGGFARKKKPLIDHTKHLIIESAHPSPLSVYRGFFGSKPFSRTNEYLQKHQFTPIDWRIA